MTLHSLYFVLLLNCVLNSYCIVLPYADVSRRNCIKKLRNLGRQFIIYIFDVALPRPALQNPRLAGNPVMRHSSRDGMAKHADELKVTGD